MLQYLMSPSLLVVQTPGLSTARNIALRAVCNFVRITVREAGDEEEWGERGPPALPPYVQKIYMSKDVWRDSSLSVSTSLSGG